MRITFSQVSSQAEVVEEEQLAEPMMVYKEEGILHFNECNKFESVSRSGHDVLDRKRLIK